MAQVVKLKRTSVQGRIPTISNLELGELAINTHDGRIFFEKDDGTLSIQEILTTNSNNSGSFSLQGAISASSFNGNGEFLTNITASYVDYTTIVNTPTLFSGSEQIDVTQTELYSSLATTGSNIYTGAQIIKNETPGQNNSLTVRANSTGDLFNVVTDNTAGRGIVLTSKNSTNTSDTKLSFSGSSFEFGGGDVNILGNLTLGGNITIGDATTDVVTVTAGFSGSLIPDETETYDLGSSSKKWNNLHVSTSRADFFIGDGSGLTNLTSSISEVTTVTSSYDNESAITIIHSFDSKNVIVSVYDTEYSQIIPQSVTLTDNDTVDIVLSSTGSGHVVVAKGGHLISSNDLTSYRVDVSGSSSYVVSHSLDEEYPFVQAWNTDTKKQEQPLDVESTSPSSLTVTFSGNFAGKIIVKK